MEFLDRYPLKTRTKGNIISTKYFTNFLYLSTKKIYLGSRCRIIIDEVPVCGGLCVTNVSIG